MPFSANSPAGSTVTCSTAIRTTRLCNARHNWLREALRLCRCWDGLQCCKLANCFFRFAAGLQKGYFDTLDDLKDAKALLDE